MCHHQCQSALRESDPPVQLGRLTPLPIGQEHKAEGEGVEPSRLIARLFSKQLPSPIGLPFRIRKAAVAGIEPAKGRLTGACLYQHRPHRNKSGWQDLNLRSQAPRACAMPGFATPWQCRRGRIRTADLVLPKHAGFPATPRTETKSAQRELNPHFRHGKAAGYRYIMGASNRWSNCQRSEHRVGLEPTSPHYGCGVLAAGRPVPFIQWDQRDLNPHRPG